MHLLAGASLTTRALQPATAIIVALPVSVHCASTYTARCMESDGDAVLSVLGIFAGS